MAAEILLTDLTNGTLEGKEWIGTGVFDKLIYAVNKNIEAQKLKGHITGEKYGDVYLGSMQSVLAQSMEYLLREQVVEMEVELKSEQIISERINQNATKARVEDEFGTIINDLDGGIQFSTSPETKHYWQVKIAEEEHKKAIEIAKTAAEQVFGAKTDNLSKEAELDRIYDYSLDKVNWSITPQNSVTDNTFDVATFIPKSKYGIEILKSRVESNVANNTADGYKADSYYKVYRSLQELLFALTNSGLIPQDDVTGGTNVFGRIVEGMEKAMNNQVGIWGNTTGIVDLNGNSVNQS